MTTHKLTFLFAICFVLFLSSCSFTGRSSIEPPPNSFTDTQPPLFFCFQQEGSVGESSQLVIYEANVFSVYPSINNQNQYYGCHNLGDIREGVFTAAQRPGENEIWIGNSISPTGMHLMELVLDFSSNPVRVSEINRSQHKLSFDFIETIYWSPDGIWIATVGNDIGTTSIARNVWVYNPATERSVQISKNTRYGTRYANPAWSEDGKFLAIAKVSEHSGLLIASFEYGVEHYSFDDLIDISNKSNPEIGEWPGANYSLVQLLMNFKQVETQRYIAAVSQPIWIGDEILFVAPTNDNRVTVWKVDKHGKGLEQFLPDLSGNLFAPRLSPAGDQIAFLRYKSWRNAHYAEILVLDLNTLEVEPILVFQKPFYSERLFISGLDWSPDGKYIGFSSNDEGDSDVYIYSIMDGSLTNITSELEGDAVFPKWLVP